MNKYEDWDKILYYAVKHKNENINANRIIRDLYPKETEEKLDFVFRSISNYNPDLVLYFDTTSSPCIQATGITEEFLQSGGFSEIYKQQQKKVKEEKEYKESELEKIKFEIIDLQKRIASHDKSQKLLKQSFIIAIISVLTAIASVIVSIMALRNQ